MRRRLSVFRISFFSSCWVDLIKPRYDVVIEPQFGVGGVELVEKGGFSKVKIPPRNKNCSKREEREI